MNPNLKWKALFILAVILGCLFGLVGLPDFPTSWALVKANFSKQIKLGLDLQGGTHMILQVQVHEAVGQHADQSADRLITQLRNRNIRYDEIRKVDDTHILVRNLAPEQSGAFRDLLSELFSDWDLAPAPGEPSGYTLTMKPTIVSGIQTQTLDLAEETIRRRIDALGLTEPVVQKHGRGDNEILVQLPGESDPTRAKDVIQAGGQLEIRRVVDERPYSSETEALSQHGGVLPPDAELVPGKSAPGQGGQPGLESWWLLDRRPIVAGGDLRSARENRSTENIGFWEVGFNLSAEAGRRFGAFTEANLERPMAIVLDHRVFEVATIKARIEDSGRITGRFTQEQAHDLSLVLTSGALPASIKYLEERTVGPSLGADSIRHGMQASVLSLVVVMIFMMVYYRLSGVNAVVALILNLVILLAVLAYFRAVLTLPGIAGVILTIGMGVDSNVLVFERIREELRSGKAPVSAVSEGFRRAFLTIIDTHVTTVVSAVFLFLFGTGPVKGFAVTLVIGLISNVFTAVFVSRMIFDWHLTRMERQAALSI